MNSLQLNIEMNNNYFDLLRQVVVDNINYKRLAEWVDTDAVADAIASKDYIQNEIINRAASQLAESIKDTIATEVASRMMSGSVDYAQLAAALVQRIRENQRLH